MDEQQTARDDLTFRGARRPSPGRGRGRRGLGWLAIPAVVSWGAACGTPPGDGLGSAGGSAGGMATGGTLGSGGGALVTGGKTGTDGGAAASGASDGGTGGSATGGSATGGSATGGSATGGSATGGSATGGSGAGSGGASDGSGGLVEDGSGGSPSGTCTASQQAGASLSGTGPYGVVVEVNADPGISEGTIFRPVELGGAELYPILVWGQGGCSLNGLSNQAAMAEIASHGYFVIADGTPDGIGNRPMDKADLAGMGAPLIGYIDWAVAQNDKPCSAYYQSLEVTKIASNGFSCGGLMAQGTITDPRIVTWGVTSSGMAGTPQVFYDAVSTPVLFVEGGPDEVAYAGGLEGYQAISQLDVPVLWFSKDIGHGGDLFQPGGGDFTKINLAWLNWWLKGDETATGKGLLVGPSCPYCADPEWEVMSTNVP